jgi:hypothetical protein
VGDDGEEQQIWMHIQVMSLSFLHCFLFFLLVGILLSPASIQRQTTHPCANPIGCFCLLALNSSCISKKTKEKEIAIVLLLKSQKSVHKI